MSTPITDSSDRSSALPLLMTASPSASGNPLRLSHPGKQPVHPIRRPTQSPPFRLSSKTANSRERPRAVIGRTTWMLHLQPGLPKFAVCAKPGTGGTHAKQNREWRAAQPHTYFGGLCLIRPFRPAHGPARCRSAFRPGNVPIASGSLPSQGRRTNLQVRSDRS